MASCLICYFIVILFFLERMTSYEKFSHDLTLELLPGKVQRFNAIVGSVEMLKNSWISKNFN